MHEEGTPQMTEIAGTNIDVCRRVGLVHLICASVSLVYCVIELFLNGSASFLLFGYFLATGLLLYKGNLRAAQITAFLAAVWTAISAGVLLALLWQFPLDFILAGFKFHTATAASVAAVELGMLAVSAWSYRTLRHPGIRAALEDEMIVSNAFFRRPSLGFIAGGLFVLMVFAWVQSTFPDDIDDRARIEASKQLGEGYRYQVIHINLWGQRHRNVNARVVAYNDDEMKTVAVSWSD